MRIGATLKLAAAAAGVTVAAVQVAHEIIRRHETLDPESVERPGAMFYLRGVGIHFIEAGHGPPVLMIHGFGGSTFSFRHQIARLARCCRVVAVDLPGFGYSDRPLEADLSLTGHATRLIEFIERLDLGPATIIGHSMGAGIAMRIAATRPDLVNRLILAAGVAPDEHLPAPWYTLLRPLMPIPLAALWLAEGRLRRAAAAGAYDPAYMTDDVWRGYYTPLKLRGASAALIKLIADVRRQPTLDPATVGARTLLLWGEADPATPLRIAHRLHATMPDARLEVIPRAGHLVLEEQPDACNAAILTFLAAENIISATGATAHV